MMLRLYKHRLPKHKFGMSYRFDFPINSEDKSIVGVFAKIDNADGFDKRDYFIIGNVSLSVDGSVFVPCCQLLSKTPKNSTANKMMMPVDFAVSGNKLTVIIEEFPNKWITEFNDEFRYDISVYVKTLCK